MNITYENFIELQPDTADPKSNQRLWNFLLISFLLHLLIIELLIDHNSQSGFPRPYKIIPPLTITLNRASPAVRTVPASPPVTPVKETDKIEQHENSTQQTIPLTAPATVPPEIIISLPFQPEQKPPSKAKELVEKSLDQADKVAKSIEARANPGPFMTNTNKDKLAMALMMLDQQDPEIDNPAKLQVYSNQYGDYVYQTGDTCMVVPAVLFLYTFKERNSIIATPISCGNGKETSNFSLK